MILLIFEIRAKVQLPPIGLTPYRGMTINSAEHLIASIYSGLHLCKRGCARLSTKAAPLDKDDATGTSGNITLDSDAATGTSGNITRLLVQVRPVRTSGERREGPSTSTCSRTQELNLTNLHFGKKETRIPSVFTTLNQICNQKNKRQRGRSHIPAHRYICDRSLCDLFMLKLLQGKGLLVVEYKHCRAWPGARIITKKPDFI